jgi:hypothetical protein
MVVLLTLLVALACGQAPAYGVAFQTAAINGATRLVPFDLSTLLPLTSKPALALPAVSFSFDVPLHLGNGRWLAVGLDEQKRVQLCQVDWQGQRSSCVVAQADYANFQFVSFANTALVTSAPGGEQLLFSYAINSTDPDIHACDVNTQQGQCAVYLLGWRLDGTLVHMRKVSDFTGELIGNVFMASARPGEVSLSSYGAGNDTGQISVLFLYHLATRHITYDTDNSSFDAAFSPGRFIPTSMGNLVQLAPQFIQDPLPEYDTCLVSVANYSMASDQLKTICCFRTDEEYARPLSWSISADLWWTLLIISKMPGSPAPTEMAAWTVSFDLKTCKKVVGARQQGPFDTIAHMVQNLGIGIQGVN